MLFEPHGDIGDLKEVAKFKDLNSAVLPLVRQDLKCVGYGVVKAKTVEILNAIPTIRQVYDLPS